METFLIKYGYLAVMLGTFIEGEAALLTGSLMANQGYLNFWFVVVAAIIGSQLTDWLYFILGRTKGTQFITKRPVLQQKATRIYSFVEKYPTTILLLYRYMYGFRTIIPLVIGLSKISKTRFWLIGLLGTLSWAIVFASIGFWLGKAAEPYFNLIGEYKWHLIAGLIAVILTFVLISKLRQKNKPATESETL